MRWSSLRVILAASPFSAMTIRRCSHNLAQPLRIQQSSSTRQAKLRADFAAVDARVAAAVRSVNETMFADLANRLRSQLLVR